MVHVLRCPVSVTVRHSMACPAVLQHSWQLDMSKGGGTPEACTQPPPLTSGLLKLYVSSRPWSNRAWATGEEVRILGGHTHRDTHMQCFAVCLMHTLYCKQLNAGLPSCDYPVDQVALRALLPV
jgi:hypothetical protein